MESKRACINFLDAVSVYLFLMRCTKVFLGGGGGAPRKSIFHVHRSRFDEAFEEVACVLIMIGPTLKGFLIMYIKDQCFSTRLLKYTDVFVNIMIYLYRLT